MGIWMEKVWKCKIMHGFHKKFTGFCIFGCHTMNFLLYSE